MNPRHFSVLPVNSLRVPRIKAISFQCTLSARPCDAHYSFLPQGTRRQMHAENAGRDRLNLLTHDAKLNILNDFTELCLDAEFGSTFSADPSWKRRNINGFLLALCVNSLRVPCG